VRSKPLVTALGAVGLVLAVVLVLREAGRGGVAAPPAAVDVVRAEGEETLPTPPATSTTTEPASAREPVSDAERAAHAATRSPGASIPATGALHGVLRERGEGAPVPGATLRFAFEGGEARATTDESGAFATAAALPPGIARVSVVDGVGGPLCSPEVEPQRVLVRGPEEAQPELALTLLVPTGRLEVLVTHEGVPTAADLEVMPRGLVPRPPSGTSPLRTDEQGRLWILLCEAEVGTILLRAHEGELESHWEHMLRPWPVGPLHLELHPTGRILVRVSDPDGQPLSGILVELGRERFGRTNRLGELPFERVGCGPQYVRIDGRTCEREWLHVEVEPFAEARLEHVLDRSSGALLVAGRIVDEAGSGCDGVRVDAQQGPRWFGAESGPDGSFEIRADAPDMDQPVTVVLGGSVHEVRFEPGPQSVAAGTRDLRFVRRSSPEEVPLALAAWGADGDPIESGFVTFFRRGYGSTDTYSLHDGLLEVSVTPHDDLQALFRARGWRDRILSWAELAAGAQGRNPLRVTLEPGLDVAVRVVAAASAEPVAGARILADESLLALTDGEGRARVSAALWPGALRIVADGFAEGSIDLGTLPERHELLCALARR
jgi:hypothetical protein